MGGKFQTNLNANVTHLVCGTCAASEKYFVNPFNVIVFSFYWICSSSLGGSWKWYSSNDARMATECSRSFRTKVMQIEEKSNALFNCFLERSKQQIQPLIDLNVHSFINLSFHYRVLLKEIEIQLNNMSNEKVRHIHQVWSKIPVLIWSVKNRKVIFEYDEEVIPRGKVRLGLGSKFEHAIKWRIPALKPEWIFESSEKGSCLRLTNFLWSTSSFD